MSKLFIVPTSIGNLADITYRATDTLKKVQLILAEDTRVTKKLLDHYQIQTPTKSYHNFNEHKLVDGIVEKIQSGITMALVSDAGTPGISDPGYLLINKCIVSGVAVECLPGATAFVPSLILSGFPNNRFVFEGFLPHKKGRQKRLQEVKEQSKTMIFYESPHRLIKTLNDFMNTFGKDRQISVSRELTKKFEETVRGSIDEVKAYFTGNIIKGEFVIVVYGKEV